MTKGEVIHHKYEESNIFNKTTWMDDFESRKTQYIIKWMPQQQQNHNSFKATIWDCDGEE